MDKIFIFIGTICAVLCGFGFPLMMYLFGVISGHIVNYASIISTNITQKEKEEAMDAFMQQGRDFMVYIGLLGVFELCLTYIGNTLFCISAARQVSVINFQRTTTSRYFLRF